jgi:hypothetical protein
MHTPRLIPYLTRLAAMVAAGTLLVVTDAALAKGRGVVGTMPSRVRATSAYGTATGSGAARTGNSIVSPPPNAVSIPNTVVPSRGGGNPHQRPSSLQ